MKCRIKSAIALALASVIALTSESVADTITLKPSVRLDAGATSVKLADIAELEGAAAHALANVQVIELAGSNAVEVSVQEVRRRLDEAGAPWGKIILNGRSVTVRPVRIATEPLLAMQPLSLESNAPAKRIAKHERTTTNAHEAIASPALRGIVARLLVTHLSVQPVAVRFACGADDDELLDMEPHATRFEVQPLNNVKTDRVEMNIRIWADGQVQQTRTISIYPQILSEVAVLRREITKGQVISDEDVAAQQMWLSPTQASQRAGRVTAVGRIAGMSLKTGEILRERDIRRETLIKRGDTAIVRCMVGGAVISMQAEARSEGSEGDTIEFRKLGERETFRATITGRGEAVLDLSRRQAHYGAMQPYA